LVTDGAIGDEAFFAAPVCPHAWLLLVPLRM